MEDPTIIGVLAILAIIILIIWHSEWKRKEKLKWYNLITRGHK